VKGMKAEIQSTRGQSISEGKKVEKKGRRNRTREATGKQSMASARSKGGAKKEEERRRRKHEPKKIVSKKAKTNV